MVAKLHNCNNIAYVIGFNPLSTLIHHWSYLYHCRRSLLADTRAVVMDRLAKGCRRNVVLYHTVVVPSLSNVPEIYPDIILYMYVCAHNHSLQLASITDSAIASEKGDIN